MATADAKESLDWWRKFFSCAKSDIFELIDGAIMVAATDHPKEFMVRKDLIVQKLCTALNNGDEGGRTEQSETDGEVMRIKEVLCNHENESDSVLYESLKRLELMQLSVETLMATEIGRTVNDLRKDRAGQIRKIALSLIKSWKVLVDERIAKKNATESSVMKSSSTDSRHGGSPKLTSEQKQSSHLSAGVERKRSKEASETSRLEIAKRKLQEGYQRIENWKKRRQIQIIELRDLPKESHENGRSRKKLPK
ncbi:probable mediator of RNA polymerase II transcription subunit 26b [Phalaenopsis equestris]|uniref:probable mediator of RNA polymerase II transcription subunit 26b n=1 Tax=Phalaenopsis equestris TaxID=78828 RepID=UPI0009E54C57|nr:probable mediator of RNA polymerase II transcription subunit 26b [Phalaenopsis equestris]